MNLFQPKHTNHIFKYPNNGLFITLDGHVIPTKYMKACLLDDIIENVSYPKYEIICDGDEMTYDELILVDNVVSVCCSVDAYHILLSNCKIIHIYQDIHKPKILELDKICSSIEVEYFNANHTMLLLYSNNKLYKFDNSYKLEVYYNVIGYLMGTTIFLILESDYKVKCIFPHKLHKVELDEKIEVDNDDILNGISLEGVTCISLHYNQIYVVVEGIVHYFTSFLINNFNFVIKDVKDIKSVGMISTVYFCILDNNTLLLKPGTKDEYEVYVGVQRHLTIAGYLILFHFDGSLTVFNPIESKEKRTIAPYKNPEFYSFLTCETNIPFLNRISIFLSSITFDTNYYLIYINLKNSLEILDIVTLEFVSLSVFFGVPEDEYFLDLIENNNIYI